MEINRSNINEIVTKASLRPDKDYGQNFLVEPVVCQKIADALNIQEGDLVLEVGPGLGSLTHFISEKKVQYDAVDIDIRMVNFLRVVYQDYSNVKIIENDIRKHDVSKYNKIIGNLPYNITTETIQYFLTNAINADRLVFMIQSETLAHFYDISGKEYGPVSVLLHLLGNIEKLFTVKAGSFYPAPKCSSVVFAINIDKQKDRQEAIGTFNLAKKLFLNRRKTIQNNLLNALKDKGLVIKLCNDLSINPLARPEDLSPNTYLEMCRYLQK
ncbi:MAG: ribosomal RNA small subunit methyltransferase A [Bacilli bacterium]|nr:ribosomal RNA small subunit methyltransferase A [Bacilli bacterium]